LIPSWTLTKTPPGGSRTDAAGQQKNYAYAADNRVLGISYANAVNPTPSVGFTYDPDFRAGPR